MNRIGMSVRESDRRMASGHHAEAPETVVDFDRILAGLRRQIWVYAFWIFLMIVLGLAISVTTPPTYRALATLMLFRDGPAVAGATGRIETSTEDDIETAEQVLRSRALALQVTDQLDLSQDPRFVNRPTAPSARFVNATLGMGRGVIDSIADLFVTEEPTTMTGPPGEEGQLEAARQNSARFLQSNIGVRRIGRSAAMNVEFDLYDPVLSAEIVNAYIDAYVDDQITSVFDRHTQTAEWMQQRLVELERAARDAAIDAHQFRMDNELVMVRGALVSEGNIDRFNVELMETRAEAARLRAVVAAHDAALAVNPETLAEDDALRRSLPGDEQFDTLRNTLNSLRARRAEVIRDFGPDHPQVDILDRRIGDAARRLHTDMARLVEVARGMLEVAETQVMSLQEALDPVIATNAEASRATVELSLLQQREESLARLHEAFLVELEQSGQFASFPTSNVRILTAAEIPRDPIAPSKRMAVQMAVLLGLLLGTVHAVGREWRDRGLRTAADVTDGLGEPFLGFLPSLGKQDKITLRSSENRRKTERRVTGDDTSPAQEAEAELPEARGRPPVEYPLARLADPYSAYCETLRSIRNASMRANARKSSTILGVTSLTSGEGKTYMIPDLADMIALQNGPTLLIDCDFRKLSLSRAIRSSHGASIDATLNGQSDWREHVVRLAGTKVDVLAWDTKAPVDKPGELLGSAAMHALLRDATAQYDTVILDLAALGPAVDVREVLPVIDQILLLAQWGRTSRRDLAYALRTEPGLQHLSIGVAMSNVNLRALRRYDVPAHIKNEYRYGT